MQTKTYIALSLALMIFVPAVAALADDFDISWYTIDGGGGYSAGADFELEGTVGQTDAGTMSGGAFTLTGGFWAGVETAPLIPGDCDADGDVDLGDYAVLAACLAGPEGGLGLECGCFDFDEDDDVDTRDAADFMVGFTGE
jgi:hypothetical protein